MRRSACALAASLMAIGLIASACGSSDDDTATSSVQATQPSTTTSGTLSPTIATQPATPTPTAGGADLHLLIITPANTQRAYGPYSIHDNGIYMYFQVNGALLNIMDADKTSLEGVGWTLTFDRERSRDRAGGDIEAYSGTNGDAVGVFSAVGSGDTVVVHSCVWPSKPVDFSCGFTTAPHR